MTDEDPSMKLAELVTFLAMLRVAKCLSDYESCVGELYLGVCCLEAANDSQHDRQISASLSFSHVLFLLFNASSL